ncbi:MAG: hypothetical protein ACFE9R_06580, partial [Candidatus Hermodarchaeota archaeon]
FNGKNEDHLSNTVQNGKVNSEFDLLGNSKENIQEITQEMIDKFINDPNRPKSLVEQWAIERGLPLDQVGDFIGVFEREAIEENRIQKRTLQEQEKFDLDLVNFHKHKQLMGSQWNIKKSDYLQKIRRSSTIIESLQNYKDFKYIKNNLDALDYLIDDLKLKENNVITTEQQLDQFINQLGDRKNFIVYRIVNKYTGLERHGESDDIPAFKHRLLGYFSESKKPGEHAFRNELFNALNLQELINKEVKRTDLVSRFFNTFYVELWVCDTKVEMDALELFNQLYYNRADTDILSDLAVNEHFNPVYGNSFYNSKGAFSSAGDLIKLFKYSLSADLVRQTHGNIIASTLTDNCERYLNGKTFTIRVNNKIIDITFDKGSSLIDMRQLTYEEALRQYTIAISRKESDTDNRYYSDNKLSGKQKKDLIWTAEGPEGKVIGLFYGIGNGLSESYFENIETFTDWFDNKGENDDEVISIDNRPSMNQISSLVYDAIVAGNYHKTMLKNIYEYKVIINGETFSFTIEIDNNNRITKITPVE